ncbi:hypothetical protein PG993_004458 [Apiospora rasikravindrae]|uniref:Uncharacterized protein n=1 Tax=Apiospora rasikravindrae TaxID=990691 RepID=A0ABR1TF89_9PEZI
MASFGKLSNSLIQGVNENTLALANLNFDFSLVKVQAPVEFQEIGLALAETRRQNAEAGTSHQTARKLGALFESLVPPVPGVIAAYGQRASQIIQKPGANPSGSTEKHGPFAAFVGADATGIWAAATSGQASIATHLLACMLARTFRDPAKAVSAWAELVHERKQEILAYNTHSTLSMAEIAALNASNQQVTREELRLWDASARAWLQTADSGMRREHVQLKLILQNLSIPVTAGPSLYASVIKAWSQALVGVERLLAGEPQSVTNGAILLAISAWHLYPDLLVFSSQTTSINFSDPLMNPSGVLTVGITNEASPSVGKEGIYWSVALSHYRHYGHPTKAVSEVDDRMTMGELYLVTLGGLLKLWGEPRANFEQAARWFVALWRCVHRAKAILSGPAWIKPLAEAAARFLDATDHKRKELLSLVDFGFRRGRHFLLPNNAAHSNLPWFGLRSPHIVDSLRQSSSTKCAIEYLRQTAAACNLDPYKTIITVIETKPEKMNERHGYFTALPIAGPEEPQSSDESSSSDDEIGPIGAPQSSEPDCKGKSRQKSPVETVEHRSWVGLLPSIAHLAMQSRTELLFRAPHQRVDYSGSDSKRMSRKNMKRKTIVAPLVCPDYNSFSEDTIAKFRAELPPLDRFSRSTTYFAAVIGEDTRSISLWLSQDDLDAQQTSPNLQKLRQGKLHPLLNLQQSIDILEDGINPYLTWQYLEGADPYDPDDHIKPVLNLMRWERSYWRETAKSLKSLATANEIYKNLEGATISSTIIARGIHGAKWAPNDVEVSLTRSKVFSCIAMMETGTVSLDAKRLDNVLALATGNSIYILRHFVVDPSVEVAPAAVVRIVGNVGRAGISLLVPPASQPLIRPLSNSLRAVAYANFDGKRENNFTSTSLHLSFTPHEFPLDYGVTGIIDHQVFFVESVISVHDSGKWVADLDIIGPFQDDARLVLKLPRGNRAKPAHVHSEEKKKAALGSFVSIDTWEEVLDAAPTHSLVRASGNWAARLAVLAAILQNSARGPNFTANDDDDDPGGKEEEGEGEGAGEDQGYESEGVPDFTSHHHGGDRVRVAILESREDVCWVCMHIRLSKMDWLGWQEPCYIIT